MAGSTIWAPVGDKGPDGDKGPIGDKGPTGDQGPPGPGMEDFMTKAELLLNSGSSKIRYTTGATVEDKLGLVPLDPVKDFGADNTGVVNATTAMKAFFDACIATGRAGHIPAGSYLITAGVLAFDNNHIDTAWPDITTDGHYFVKFLKADATDAPFITWTNGTAISGAGKYWKGGSLGGITFLQNGKATARQQHALSLQGIWGTKFGWMQADDLGGSVMYIAEKLYSGTNPDPYAVTFCTFDCFEGNRVGGMVVENRNYLSMNLCTVTCFRGIETGEGGWFGLGTGNKAELVSMGSCRGWAFDDGTNLAATGGTPSRFKIGLAEIDNPENGIRLNRFVDFEYGQLRFVHRANFGINATALFWPRTAFDMGNGTTPNVSHVRGFAQHRLEAGGLLANLGQFIRGNGAGAFTAYDMDNRILDNGSYGIDDSRLFTNIGTIDFGVIRRDVKPVSDIRVKVAALVRAAASETVPNSGFGTAGAKLVYATELYDRGGGYDIPNSWYVIPYTGLYRVTGQFALTVAIGTRIRLGFAIDVGGVITVVKSKTDYATTAAAQHYDITGVVSLTAGQRLFFMADQNTASAATMSVPSSTTADLTWSIEAL